MGIFKWLKKATKVAGKMAIEAAAEAANAIDGDPQTVWTAKALTPLVVDMGKASEVIGFIVTIVFRLFIIPRLF